MVIQENNFTTIAVTEKTRERVERLKIHPNQSFDEVLNELLDFVKSDFRRQK